jgi:hypothetical protein
MNCVAIKSVALGQLLGIFLQKKKKKKELGLSADQDRTVTTAHLHDLKILHILTLRLHQFTDDIIPLGIRAICGSWYRWCIRSHGIEGIMNRKCRGW